MFNGRRKGVAGFLAKRGQRFFSFEVLKAMMCSVKEMLTCHITQAAVTQLLYSGRGGNTKANIGLLVAQTCKQT